jgi:hypothetical protein
MPSTLHEALVLLFRESPGLAPLLVARALDLDLGHDRDPARELGVDLGLWAGVQVTSAEFADLDPPEYRADVVLRIPDKSGRDHATESDRDHATREVFIVEVQLDPDQLKHFTWPQYVTSARTRFRCRATLVVVTVDERVSRWCAQPIELDLAGNVFRPMVIGPAAIPVVTDEAQARMWPELAVFSVIAHGHESGSEAIGAAALAACDRLDNSRSDFAKKYVAQGIEPLEVPGPEIRLRVQARHDGDGRPRVRWSTLERLDQGRVRPAILGQARILCRPGERLELERRLAQQRGHVTAAAPQARPPVAGVARQQHEPHVPPGSVLLRRQLAHASEQRIQTGALLGIIDDHDRPLDSADARALIHLANRTSET